MKKRVIVQEDLEEIKEGLINLGYEVVNIDEGENIDAIVYMADGYDIEYHNSLANMNSGIDMANYKGTVLVNAKGRSLEEISYIIENRLYSPLFD